MAGLAGALLCAAGLAEQEFLLPVLALGPEGVVVPGVRFRYGGVERPETTDAGVTELRIPLGPGKEIPPRTALELLLPASPGRAWFLIDDTVHVPGPDQPPAEVVQAQLEVAIAAFRETPRMRPSTSDTGLSQDRLQTAGPIKT